MSIAQNSNSLIDTIYKIVCEYQDVFSDTLAYQEASNKTRKIEIIASPHCISPGIYQVVEVKSILPTMHEAICAVEKLDKTDPSLGLYNQMLAKLLTVGLLIIDTNKVIQTDLFEEWRDVILFAIVDPIVVL